MAKPNLQGGCSCGRNQYHIALPAESDTRRAAQVLFGETSELRRAYASALPTFLRIPLPWLQSTTYAYYDDEKPSDIRRVFTPISAPHTKRNFCGYCGTSLSFWSEATSNEADFICMNLASLEQQSLDLLEVLRVLPSADDDEAEEQQQVAAAQMSSDGASSGVIARSGLEGGREIRGQPWFEELIESGPLGRLKRRRGGQTSRNGNLVVEWEVVEMDDGEEGAQTPSKKTLVDTSGDGDVRMKGN